MKEIRVLDLYMLSICSPNITTVALCLLPTGGLRQSHRPFFFLLALGDVLLLLNSVPPVACKDEDACSPAAFFILVVIASLAAAILLAAFAPSAVVAEVRVAFAAAVAAAILLAAFATADNEAPDAAEEDALPPARFCH